jgi:general nucleoside transport system permease protein
MMAAVGVYRRSGGWVRAFIALGLTFSLTAALIGFSGKNPITAYEAMFRGAFGSFDRAAYAINKATPYIISGIGIALCFRAGIINIGAEGQIALGGLAATWVALAWPKASPLVGIPLAFGAGMIAGALWSGIAAVIHVGRGVNEVLATLLLNFVALLLVGEVLHGDMGEPGAGFPQSPLFEPNYWLSTMIAGAQLHWGVVMGPLIATGGYVLLRYTTLGFAVRVLGASRSAASYAGFSVPQLTIKLMLMAGGLAGLAGVIEVLGIHYRLIEGFSSGFGFNAVVVALLGALHPLAIIPAGLFFGFLEAGALSMQREVGVPSSLVAVIQGLTMLFVLAALAASRRNS